MITKLKIFLFVIVTSSLYAQKHDYVWLMGYYGQNPHPDLGGIEINFNYEPPLVKEAPIYMSLRKTNSTVSDYDGNLLFYTNGLVVADNGHNLMVNGDSLNPTPFSLSFYESGLNNTQGTIVLPSPNGESEYYIFHEPIDFNTDISIHIPRIYYSKVEQSIINGDFLVVEKNILILEDTLMSGKLTATKHANGRDWWIIGAEEDDYTNNFYVLLLDDEGVTINEKQAPGPGLYFTAPSIGQAVFSPDGTKYVRHDVRFDPFSAIDIYDFDRCTGQFTHLEHFELNDTTGLSSGAAISSDSRYLYIITRPKVYQYDLEATDIKATEKIVAEYDGYVAIWFESAFSTAQLAPNGKIYFASSSSDTVMHLIHTPNQPGFASHVAQHSLVLPNLNDKSIPNFPNYRLGPLDGSPCDTLGLDNHPLAGFTYFADELAITFSDNSYYRPEEWEWDFGDGNGSNERNPLHSYGEPGEYYVCLTVKNEIDEDTYCRWVEVDTLVAVSTYAPQPEVQVEVFPNPADDHLLLEMDLPAGYTYTFSLHDVMGRVAGAWEVEGGRRRQSVSLDGIPAGLYFWRLSEVGNVLKSGKVVVK